MGDKWKRFEVKWGKAWRKKLFKIWPDSPHYDQKWSSKSLACSLMEPIFYRILKPEILVICQGTHSKAIQLGAESSVGSQDASFRSALPTPSLCSRSWTLSAVFRSIQGKCWGQRNNLRHPPECLSRVCFFEREAAAQIPVLSWGHLCIFLNCAWKSFPGSW